MEATSVKTSATFSGGVHPAGNKELTSQNPTVTAALPKRVVIPLSQHIGAPTKPLVVIGQEVKKGEKIGESGGFVSPPVHATVSGKVTAIGNFPHSMGMDMAAVVIESDGKDEWVPGIKETSDYLLLSPDELKKMVSDAGVVGNMAWGFLLKRPRRESLHWRASLAAWNGSTWERTSRPLWILPIPRMRSKLPLKLGGKCWDQRLANVLVSFLARRDCATKPSGG